jgi:LmbE family N-acetylglucosaminyl deacetylase
MTYHNTTAEIFIPDGLPETAALSCVTHLGIGAHQDDLEFMAFHGILECYQNDSQWFAGVTCTNGAGSSRSGPYVRFSDEQMQAIRRKEQNLAAQIGQFAAMIQLDYPSAAVKDPHGSDLRDDLIEVLRATRPRVVYTHNLADKHDTHLGVTVAAIQAMRTLPPEERPEAVHGCEVWRNLDWLSDSEKIVHDVSSRDNLAAALNGVFDSQIAGGKRYDLGVLGRRRANATFFESHAVDRADSIAFAMDLTPLVRDESLDVAKYVDGFIGRFRDDVFNKLQQRLGR